MSKTFEVNELTGEQVPSKSRRKVKDRKDFDKSCYHSDSRPKAVKKAKVDALISDEMINFYLNLSLCSL